MQAIATFVAGLLFGLGLFVSGLINPAKVLAFLDIAGAWDPSLAFVMGSALTATFACFRIILRRPHPLFAPDFHVPSAWRIDSRLIGGSALFGIGWGVWPLAIGDLRHGDDRGDGAVGTAGRGKPRLCGPRRKDPAEIDDPESSRKRRGVTVPPRASI